MCKSDVNEGALLRNVLMTEVWQMTWKNSNDLAINCCIIPKHSGRVLLALSDIVGTFSAAERRENYGSCRSSHRNGQLDRDSQGEKAHK